MTSDQCTLRKTIDQCKANGKPLSLNEALFIVVPLIVKLAEEHESGRSLYIYPSALLLAQDGSLQLTADTELFPRLPEDLAMMAPELSDIRRGDARASVYAVAALIYELITLNVVGPLMKRPSELIDGISQDFELILSKALVAEPKRRPDDLLALAQAFHLINPRASIAPPAAELSHLDHDDGFEVDISLSMLPPPVNTGFQPSIGEAPLPPHLISDPSTEFDQEPGAGALSDREMLGLIKQRLQQDPTARYVVVSSGMDHGPFNAIELVQQITRLTFAADDLLKDNITGSSGKISEFPQFEPFARHARLLQSDALETEAIEEAVRSENRSTKSKALIGLSLLGVLVALLGSYLFTSRGTRNDAVKIQQEVAANIDSDQSVKARKRPSNSKKRVSPSPSGVPQVRGGLSCAAAQSTYVRELKMNGPRGKADLTAGAFGKQLNSGSYLNGCNINDQTSVSICAAIQNGKAVGVTVTTSPKNRAANSCVANRVRAMQFPRHSKLDITTTTFAAQ